jgi:hypothetical protein
MTSSRARVAAVTATILAPAIAVLATLFVAAAGPVRAIPEGPIEGGGWTARARGWLEFSGFYPAELDADRSFSWMGPAGRIRLPRLDRSAAYKLSLWVQPAVTDRPVELTAAVDGIALPPRALVPGPQRIDIELPPQPSTRAIVTLGASPTVVPGPGDPRTLGIRVDGIALEPAGGRLSIPADSLRAAAIAGLGLGVLLTLTMGGGAAALAFGTAAGVWLGFLLAYDGSFLGPYPERAQAIGLAAGALGLGLAVLGDNGERWSFRAAAGAVILLSACKLALFFHPMATVGDSVFHVHRAQVVQRGEYFFTSITPRPFFEFPYPPGLYVAVAPLWQMFQSDIEHVRLLRTAVIAAEGLLALAIYLVVFANWGSRLTAFLAAVISLLVPVGLYTICTSNLTNSFGQAMFGIGLAALLCAHLRGGRIAAAAGAVLLSAGFLSHFSTFSIGVPLVFACALAAFAGGAGPPRRAAVALALALVIATSASVIVYYAHFVPVYRRTAERVLAREGEAQNRSMVAPVSVKVRRNAAMVWSEFGLAVLLAAAAGGARLVRSRARDPLALALAAWAAVVIGFWLLGIVTAVEMRASLAALPLAAMLVAVALAAALKDGAWGRAAAAAALAAIALHAVSDWCMCLGIERFWAM